MANDKKVKAEKAKKVAKAIEDVKAGKDIIDIALGAKNLVTLNDAINNFEIAELFAAPKRRVGRPTKYDPSMLDTMLELGRKGASKEKIALYLGISKETLYAWKEENEEFSDALNEAMLLSQVWWENVGQTGTIGMVEGWNPNNWQFFMKTRFGDNYREVKITEINNTGAPLIDARSITINARELDEDTQDKLRSAIAAIKMLQGDSDD